MRSLVDSWLRPVSCTKAYWCYDDALRFWLQNVFHLILVWNFPRCTFFWLGKFLVPFSMCAHHRIATSLYCQSFYFSPKVGNSFDGGRSHLTSCVMTLIQDRSGVICLPNVELEVSLLSICDIGPGSSGRRDLSIPHICHLYHLSDRCQERLFATKMLTWAWSVMS